MRKVIVVAVREYQAAVRTKAFIITLVAMPILMGGGVLLSVALKDRVDTTDKNIAVLDRSGILFDRLHQAAETRNQKAIFAPDTGRLVRPKYILHRAEFGTDDPTPAQLAEQCRKIRSGDLFALVVINPDVQTVSDGETVGGIDLYSDATSFDEFNDWLGSQVNEVVRERRFADAGLPKDQIDQCLARVPVEAREPLRIDAETGQVGGGTKKSRGADVLVPMATMFLMFLVITVGASPLINSVLEEKMQRIAEVLLGSVTPFQLMTGKLVGMVGVSATILTVYLAGAVFGARSAGAGEFIPPNLGALVVWFVIYQGLAVLMFGAVFTAIGAACSDMKEAQTMLMPVWIVICFPMFIWLSVVREPTSTFSMIASFIPPATPLLMMLRAAALPGLPLWQPVLGAVLVLLTTVACVFVAGRIFRVGILMQGKGANLRQLFRWAVSG
jgi:ABC-2 type transport system permease protein